MECPVCGINIKDKNLRTHILNSNNQESKLYHCRNCDIQFWYPLKIIDGFYEDETDLAHFGTYQKLEEGLSLNQKAFLSIFH